MQCSACCDILIPPLLFTTLWVTWLAQVWGEKNGLQLPSSVLKLPLLQLNTHTLIIYHSYIVPFIRYILCTSSSDLTLHYPLDMGVVGSRWKVASVQTTTINLPGFLSQDFTSEAWDQGLCYLVGRKDSFWWVSLRLGNYPVTFFHQPCNS